MFQREPTPAERLQAARDRIQKQRAASSKRVRARLAALNAGAPASALQGAEGFVAATDEIVRARQILDAPKPQVDFVTAEEAFDRTMGFEGGGVLHRNAGDRGGTTKWGISSRANPGVDIENLSREQAFEIYKKQYWNPVKADSLPPKLRGHVVDAAFNMGVGSAGILLQKAINLHGAIRGTSIVALDGRIGPQTIAVLDTLDDERITTLFRHLRTQEYIRRAQRPGQGKWLFGWLKRS